MPILYKNIPKNEPDEARRGQCRRSVIAADQAKRTENRIF